MQHSSSVGPSFLLTLLLSLSNFYSAFAQGDSKDWPQWRGPNQSGALSDPGFSWSKDAFVLQVAWKKPLGSGYSGISVADGRAVTMFSDDTFDYLIAIDANNGDELWRFRIDSTYLGHGGSDNGPSSTPAIADGQVFAIGRKGHLLALDVKNGEKIWSRHLVNDDNAKAPFYGFATSPIVYEDILVVQTGGARGNAVSGFDKSTGELLWSTGDDKVLYQSPTLVPLFGKMQIIGTGGQYGEARGIQSRCL